MSDRSERKGLGRGLTALLSDAGTTAQPAPPAAGATSPDTKAPIENLHPNPDQPRRTFAEAELEELAASIRQNGVIQPLIVRALPARPGHFQIVAGERRWRAAQRAQLHELPVVVRELSDIEVLEIAIIENIQRADLNPLEEAMGYRQLMDRFGHTQEQLAEGLGKSRSHIANLLRLLNLPESVLSMVKGGQLSAGHARALVPLADPLPIAEKIVKSGMSVRQAEALAKASGEPKPAKKKNSSEKDADTIAIEGDLSAHLGMRCSIAQKGEGGEVRISYKSLDQLDALLQRLTH